MKLFLSLLFAICFFTQLSAQYIINDSCTDFTLKVDAKNLPSDTIVLLYTDCNKISDTIVLSHGKAIIKGKINRAVEALLFSDIKNKWFDAPSVIRFILEPGDMALHFLFIHDSAKKVTIEGSDAEKEKENWENKNFSLLNLREKYRDLITVLSLERKEMDSIEFKKNYSTLNDKFSVLTELLIKVVLRYINVNPQSYFSGYLLNHYKRLTPIDTLQTYFSSLAQPVMNSDLGKRILEELFKSSDDWSFRKKFTDSATYKSLRKINTIYDISLPNLEETETSFSKFKGNVLVIDFWASWCGPCIQNIPYLEKLIKEMKGKPFKVISVSVDEDSNAWRKSIKKHNFSGIHLIDDKGLLSTYFKVIGIPKYIIIKTDGTVTNMDAPQAIDPELKILIEDLLKKDGVVSKKGSL